MYMPRRTFIAALPALLATAASDALVIPSGEGVRPNSGELIADRSFTNLTSAIRIGQPVHSLRIENCTTRNVYRFLDVYRSGSASSASLTDFVMTDVEGTDILRGMARIGYASARGRIERVTARGAARQDDACVGFGLFDEAWDILYKQVEARDFRETERPDEDYWNGDGFSDERGNQKIRYVDCLAVGCSDGGFDLKSQDVLLERCRAVRNKRNFRLWGDGTLRDCISENPKWYGGIGGPAHFSFHGTAPRFLIDGASVQAPAGNTAPVLYVDTSEPARLTLRNIRIDAPDAPRMVAPRAQPIIDWT